MAKPKFKNPVVNWIDYRLGLFSFLHHELTEYPTPKNLNYMWIRDSYTCDNDYHRYCFKHALYSSR